MSNSFGMPKIKITFESLGLSAIRRSERGIALLILKDAGFADKDKKSFVYKRLSDVPGMAGDDQDCPYSEENQKMIKLAFAGEPWKLKVEVFDGTKRSLAQLLKEIELERFNYYSYPLQSDDEQDVIISWQKDVVRRKDKTIKFVAYDEAADDMQIINWAVPWVEYDGERYEGAQFTAIIASIAAGLDLQRSMTYYDFHGKIDAADMPFIEDEDAAVNAGKLFLTYDGEVYKLSRGVNSLVTHTAVVGEDQSKIRIVEAMHLIKDDIRDTFDKEYVGKILNTYQNKQQFMALINRVYFPTLYNTVIEQTDRNHVDIDMDAHRRYIITRGNEPDDMTEMQIRKYNTGSNVFLSGRLSLLDAMEDLVIHFKLD